MIVTNKLDTAHLISRRWRQLLLKEKPLVRQKEEELWNF